MGRMDILITLISVTLILGFLVFIHEGGHFLAARAFGVRVTEFMIGLPGPSIGFTRKGTRFGVTAVPLGGYAAICGMGPASGSPLLKPVMAFVYERGTVDMEDVAQEFAISNNDAFALLEELAEWGSIVRPKRKDSYNTFRTPGRLGVTEGAPQPLYDVDDYFESEQRQQYSQLPFWKRSVILCAGPLMNLLFAIVAFVVVYSFMGVDLQNTNTGEIVHYTLAPFDAVVAGFKYIGMVLVAILGLFNPATAAETVSQSTSIIGIAVFSKSAFEAGLVSFLSFSAVISVSLGLMNMLPIPPLDGGRFAIEIFQRLTRKTVSIRALNAMTTAGMVLFGAFFLIMVNQDIQRFVFGNW